MGPALSIPLSKLGVGLSFLWGSTIIYREQLGGTTLFSFPALSFSFKAR